MFRFCLGCGMFGTRDSEAAQDGDGLRKSRFPFWNPSCTDGRDVVLPRHQKNPILSNGAVSKIMSRFASLCAMLLIGSLPAISASNLHNNTTQSRFQFPANGARATKAHSAAASHST